MRQDHILKNKTNFEGSLWLYTVASSCPSAADTSSHPPEEHFVAAPSLLSNPAPAGGSEAKDHYGSMFFGFYLIYLLRLEDPGHHNHHLRR